jgi:hypothetical protein
METDEPSVFPLEDIGQVMKMVTMFGQEAADICAAFCCPVDAVHQSGGSLIPLSETWAKLGRSDGQARGQ